MSTVLAAIGRPSSLLASDTLSAERGVTAPLALVPPTHRLLDGRCDANLGDDHLHFHSLIYDELSITVDHLLQPMT